MEDDASRRFRAWRSRRVARRQTPSSKGLRPARYAAGRREGSATAIGSNGIVPTYRFCSIKCCDAGGALAQRSGGMIDTTSMERQAVKDARRAFAAVLTDLGLMAPFEGRTGADIDRIIEACVEGFQTSMRRQAGACDRLDEAVPF